MKKINIVGLGPGHPDYITPAALKSIDKSDLIIGGKRNLDCINLNGKIAIELTSDLNSIVEVVKESRNKNVVSIVASGDPMFYGISNFMMKHFDIDDLNIIPGISSVQYFASKIGWSLNDTFLASMHGKQLDIVEAVKSNNKTIVLTDHKNTIHEISKLLVSGGMGNAILTVGERLSYDDEIIKTLTADGWLKNNDKFTLCVAGIKNG